jgi:hypothetical protein
MAKRCGLSQTMVSRIWRAFGPAAAPGRRIQALQRSAVHREGARHRGLLHILARALSAGSARFNCNRHRLRKRMHEPVVTTGKWLKSVVQGYFNYYAVPGNIDSLGLFRVRVTRLWRQILIRRSQRHYLNWVRMRRLAERWIPSPRVLHPYPEVRFDAIHPR